MAAAMHSNCSGRGLFGFARSCEPAEQSPLDGYEGISWLAGASAAAFAALALFRILYLSRRQSITRAPTTWLIAKLTTGTLLTGLRIALLALAFRQSTDGDVQPAFWAAADLVASCLLLALSPLEHYKSVRPSALACSYLLVAILCDAARWPAVWVTFRESGIDGGHPAYAGLYSAAIAAEIVLLALESARRGRWVAWDAVDHSPEETSSILSLAMYSWMNALLWRGYHEPLTMRNLYPLNHDMSVASLEARDLSGLEEGPKGASNWHLFWWLAKPLGRAALLPVLPRLCLLAFAFCQPFFLQRLLRYLSSPEQDSLSAYGLVAIAGLIYAGIAVSTALYWYYQERFQTLLRSFLISAIYRKTTHLRHVGEGDPEAVTLMGADVERIYTGLRLVHELWASAVQVALGAWLLQDQLGPASLAPMVVVLMGFVTSFFLSRRAVKYQSAWMTRLQARIGVTSAVLARIKDLRLSGMTNPAADLVQREREDEIGVGEKSRVLVAVSATVSMLPQAVAPAIAFAFGPHALDHARAFTALSLLALLTSPLVIGLQSIPVLAACIACLQRIRKFLLREGRVDPRSLQQESKTNGTVAESHSETEGSIVVQDASFGWAADSNVLQRVSLRLPQSSITFVVGPVAAGKSTLCRALLGEVPHVQGQIALKSSKISYCDQSPFLFNASIKENIIGFSSLDSARYDSVIEATMLAEDLESLRAGDQTVVGTKGVSLSGGQRQRISLARALYHDADILILDDIFSGLDGSTQERVCQSVFGRDGLLRKRGTTTLICTHSTQFLPAADYIVALLGGTISEQGSLAEISKDKERAQRVGLVTANDRSGKPSKPDAEVDDKLTNGAKKPPKAARVIGRGKKPKAQDSPDNTPTVDMDVYRRWLSTIGPTPVMIYGVLIVGMGFFSNFPTVWLKLWSEDSTAPVPRHSFAYWMGIYTLLGLGAIVCVLPLALIMMRTGVRMAGTGLHHAATQTVMHSSLRFLTATDIGKVLNLFSQDMSIMDTQLPRMVNNLCICTANAIGQGVVISMSSAWLAVSYPFFVAVLWVVQRIYLPSSKRLRIMDLEAKTPLYTNFLDTLAGLPTIRAYGWFPHQLARNNALLDESQRPLYLLAMAQQWLGLTMNVLVAVVAVALVALATQLRSDAGSVGAGLVSLITLGSVLSMIVSAYTGLETSLGAISRLKSFEEETEQEDLKGEDVVPDRRWPMSGSVLMQGVEASYDGTEKVLKGLDLAVETGEKIAICGRTGSGKSSILSLLLRLIDPLPRGSGVVAGSTPAPILIDDLPLQTINRTVLRERIISASQDPVFLPDGTPFRVNLDPWGIASEAECTGVLRDLDLADVVEARGGLDAPISGAELSAGQKQLFSLARAVLRRRVKQRSTGTDGGLLLLDEITSSADAETERRVRRIIDDEFRAYTVVAVTHRREMAVACDRVLVLDAGRVVEEGAPAELLEKEGGWFKALWAGGNSH